MDIIDSTNEGNAVSVWVNNQMFPDWKETADKGRLEIEAVRLSMTLPKQSSSNGQQRPVIDVQKSDIEVVEGEADDAHINH
ncbi:MAG: hypothetical protein AAF902_09735 [Chloroflexota bacterium]